EEAATGPAPGLVNGVLRSGHEDGPGTAARPISLDPLCWLLRSALLDDVVPKGGLEPPRPCGHMTLNHARLPIPPLRHAPARTESNTPWWDGSQRRGVGV